MISQPLTHSPFKTLQWSVFALTLKTYNMVYLWRPSLPSPTARPLLFPLLGELSPLLTSTIFTSLTPTILHM